MMKRARLLAAVRDRMRGPSRRPELEDRQPVAVASRPNPRRPGADAHDHELERLTEEARYHRDRFDLYHARVVSGSSAATSLTRLRELERTATAASDRLAQARRTRRRDARTTRDADADR